MAEAPEPPQRADAERFADGRFSVAFLDRSVDPSHDFYAFANGQWLRQNPIPSDKARWGTFDELLERNFALIRRILEEARSNAAPDSSPRGQVGALYASALDVAQRNRLRFEPISGALARAVAVSNPAEVFAVLAEFHREGIGGGFASYAYPDKRASDVYAFYIEQGGIALPDREYYLDPRFEAIRSAYRAHLLRSFGSLDGGPPAERSADAVWAIETALARASRPRPELRDQERNYNRRTPAELAVLHRSIPWPEYLSARGLAEVPYVVVGQPEFLDALDVLVRERPIEQWREYLRWNVLRANAPYLHEEAELASFDFFQRVVRGQPEPEPAWKRAALVVDDCLGEALGRLYVDRAFPPSARERMAILVDDLRGVFRDRLRSLPWMSEPTRERALAKFERFTAKIGHPDVYRDYSEVRIDPADYAGNVRRAREFEVHRRVARVGGPVDRTEWGMTPPTVNAYFSPVYNEIVFPAGILQPPYFDPRMDDAVNYGGIGAVIGHEITHGYDDQGRKYDETGNLHDWWTVADAQEFDRRARQVVEQYSTFEALPGERVNGELTLGENLADLGGVSIAYEALQRRLAAEPERRRSIDGFSPEQRFFLAFAQVWRQNIRDEEVRRRLVIDTHSPGRFRVLGSALNHDGFFEAFGVQEGTPMWRPRVDRTTVW